MNEREKLEMVKMCVDALLEVKPLDYAPPDGIWDRYKLSSYPLENIQMIAEAIDDGTIFRIAKPAVKVRYRLYKWYGDSADNVGIDYITEEEELTVKNNKSFRGWIGDWQEVEIEE